MAEFPALPLWTDSYLADTRHLSTVEHGAYLLLLMEAWRRPVCGLPDDDRLLARLAGLPEAEWADVKPIVMAFWHYDKKGKIFVQKRLGKEREYVEEKRAKNREKAARRWNKTENNGAAASAGDMPETCQPTPTPTPTPPIEKEPSVPKRKGSRIPDDFKPDLDWAIDQGMQPQTALVEAAKFRDYWQAKSGKDAVKVDWPATWRNWVRSALQRLPAGRSSGVKSRSEFQQQQDRIRAELEGRNDEQSDYDNSQPAFDLGRENFRRV